MKNLRKSKQSLHDLISVRDTQKTGEFCQKLKTSNIDILNSYDDQGLTPLHIAINNQDIELVGLLLEYGADPNKRDINGNTPIITAIEQNNPKIVSILLEEGADLNKTNARKQSILKIANDLKGNKCFDILRDYGAFFIASKKSETKDTSYSGISDFINNISLLMFDIVDKSKSSVSFDFFYNVIAEHTRSLFDNKRMKIDNIKDIINNIFDQILMISTNKVFEKVDSLNATRRVINALSKLNSSGNEYNDIALILSKLENTIEDEIVNCRTLQLSKEDAVKQSKPKNNCFRFEEIIENEKETANFENSEFVKIETTKLVSRNVNHDLDLIDFVTIAPHHIRKKSEIQNLLDISEQRIKFQCDILGQDIKLFKDFKRKIDDIPLSNENEISMLDAATLDKILRIGKEEQAHIIALSFNDYDAVNGDLRNKAIELGANIYTIKYPEDPKHKLDLVYAGITAVNKLLDDNVHPDKIFIQCDSDSYKITKIIVSQFAKRGIALSEIIIADQGFDASSVENNHRCLLIHPQTHKAKVSTKYDGAFKGFFKHSAKCFKNCTIQKFDLSTEILKGYTVLQLISLFIKCNQLFLKENVKLKNPPLPTDKVDTIIGILPDEE